jgi:pimeloyl-ACP methyl ester carboxylesterase
VSSLGGEPRPQRWRRQGPGRFETELEIAAGEQLRGALRVGAQTIPFGPVSGRSGAEWRFDPDMPRQLRQMSALSGGVDRIDLEGVWESSVRRSPQGIRPLVLLVLLLLFLLEALMTRLNGAVPEWAPRATPRTAAAAKTKPIRTAQQPRTPPSVPTPEPPPVTTSRRETFRRARHGGTLLLLMLLAGLSVRPPLRGQEADPVLRSYNVPLVDKTIHTRDVLQQILVAAGSGVDLPETFPNQKIPVDRGLANLTVLGWNSLLREFGVTLRISEDAVVVTSDLRKIEGKLDQFEEAFCSFFGIVREAVLHSLTPESKGPPVVLLHGLDSTKRFFAGACGVLAAKGYDVYFFEYPNDDAIRRNAERLSKALRALPEDRRQNLSLVTVSMGGLISQYMLEHEALAVPGVRRLIACVPPFQGSHMAALRGFVEVGDHTMKIVFGENAVPDLFGDGMGRAGLDLLPGSLLMEELARCKRNPEVTYSILAGSRGIVDAPVLEKLKAELEAGENPWGIGEALRRITLERIDIMLSFQSGRGDGAVTLESARLEGVEDRLVLPFHHLQFLSGFEAKEDIPALPEVLQRLPPVTPPSE